MRLAGNAARYLKLYMIKQKIWDIGGITVEAASLSGRYNISKFFAQILINRGITGESVLDILEPSAVSFNLPDFLPDIDKAVSRIKEAVNNKQKILAVSDYDVDGVMSLSVFDKYVSQSGADVEYYIPHRVDDGYGLSSEIIEYACSRGVGLIVTFDCGTDSNEEVRKAGANGIDVIVTDHHTVKTVNCAYALVNPKRPDSEYPFSELSGAAVAFKLVQLLTGMDCHELLDLVALSIVCDVVPLRDENRLLLREGLKVLRNTSRPAIKALCKVAGIKPEKIESFHLGFVLGPRINAAGRVAHAQDALELFLTKDMDRADDFARKLNGYSIKRKEIEAELIADILENESKFSGENAIVVYGDNWHPGVLGIVASRLVERHYKPAFVISCNGEMAKGSVRSIHSLNVVDLLTDCKHLMLSYGGHSKAAGISIMKDNLEKFKDMVNEKIGKLLGKEDFLPRMKIDFPLEFSDITNELADEIDNLKPYGEGMSKALFVTKNITQKSEPRRIGYGYSLWLTDGEKTFEGMCYSKKLAERFVPGEKCDIAYSIDKNKYHNIPRLTVCDVRAK